MKIKYFKLKSNGDVAKTASYYHSLSKELCYEICYGIYWQSSTLYASYKHLLTLEEENVGDIFIEKQELPWDFIKQIITGHVNNFHLNIQNKIFHLQVELSNISNVFEKEHGKIEFEAYKKDVLIDKFKLINEQIKTLEKDNITIDVYDDRDHLDRNYIIEDIKPLTADNILKAYEESKL